MPLFRKKPVVIEAVRFDPGDDELPAVPPGVLYHPERRGPSGTWYGEPFTIMTLEGEMAVSDGDWIITGVKGEKYPCKPDIFEATYEPVKAGAEATSPSTTSSK